MKPTGPQKRPEPHVDELALKSWEAYERAQAQIYNYHHNEFERGLYLKGCKDGFQAAQ
jgi:hypothetical protein